MFCFHCGMKNSDDDRFCIQCGQALAQEEEGSPSPPAQAPSDWVACEDPTIIAPLHGVEESPLGGVFPAGATCGEPARPEAPSPAEPTPPPVTVPPPPVEHRATMPPPETPAPCVPEEPPAYTARAGTPSRRAPAVRGCGKRVGAVICLTAAVISGGVLATLLLTGGLSGEGVLLPVALGGGALVLAILALVLWLSGRARGRGIKHPLQVAISDVTKPDQVVHVTLYNPMIIGRNEEDCDLALPYERSISKQHCRLFQQGKNAFVEDLGGKNGTMLNGVTIHAAAPLHSGDQLKLGRLVLQIEIEGQG